MSVRSVRSEVKNALLDKKLTLREAENIVHVAGRTRGITAAEKVELNKAADVDAKFEPGARNMLKAAGAKPIPADSYSVTERTLTQMLDTRGLDVITALKPADTSSFGQGFKVALDNFARIADNSDGDSLASTARELKVGKDTLYAVFDYDSTEDNEIVGFFDKTGHEMGRVRVEKDKNFVMTMRHEHASGRDGEPIGTPRSSQKENVPASFLKKLKQHAAAARESGDDWGKSVRTSALPTEIKRLYEYMERNTPDGCAIEELNVEGKKAYVIHDYSCVSSSSVFTPGGKHLFTEW